jgi:hypothetical protein
VSVGAEQPGDLHAAQVLAQTLVDRLEPPLRRVGRDEIGRLRDRGLDLSLQVGCRLPVDEPEQQQDAHAERPGHAKRPTERGRTDEFRQAHEG